MNLAMAMPRLAASAPRTTMLSLQPLAVACGLREVMRRDYEQQPREVPLRDGSTKSFAAERRPCLGGVVRPVVLGVAAAHVLRDVAPTPAPETGKVRRLLDRATGRRSDRKHQWD